MKPLPFLTTIATPTRPLVSVLRALPNVELTSPWTPKPEPVFAAPAIDVEAERERGLAEGREQGLRETAELRERLAALVAELAAARDALIAPTADMIADAAATVIATWASTAPKTELFAPIVNAWIAGGQGASTVRVHPDDVVAVKQLVSDHAIVVEPDATMTPGDIRLRSDTRELAHAWIARLDELREVIATALMDSSAPGIDTEHTEGTEGTGRLILSRTES